MKYSYRIAIKMLVVLIIIGNSVLAQTLQSVTDNGNTTSNGISVSSLTSNSPSLAGAATPTNIGSLNGIRINGTIPSSSQNGITYQSGGGGGAAISFSRGGSYDTFIDFYTSGVVNSFGNISHRMRIASNGYVGIGTVSPVAKLEVNAEAGVTSFKAIGSSGYMLIDNVGTGENYYQANLAHRFQGVSNKEVFTILSGGNVGIGIVSPGEKLSVNGKIRAQEIKVEAINWPDYVFAKNYQLPSLEETEKHIKEKGHLPGVPSAEEVKSNGVDLGEMNAKLLKKIEELTLYLIEMKKENDEQKKEMSYLRSKIK